MLICYQTRKKSQVPLWISHYSLDLGGNSIQNVKAILSSNGKWSIDGEGRLVVKEIETEKLKVGSPENRTGVTIYDRLTGEPICIFSEGGLVKSEPGECLPAGAGGASNNEPATGSSTPATTPTKTASATTSTGNTITEPPAPASTPTTTP